MRTSRKKTGPGISAPKPENILRSIDEILTRDVA